MRIIHGDLWAVPGWHVLPTNMTVRKDGLAVMGRGVAAQAVQRYPKLPQLYGEHLQRWLTASGSWTQETAHWAFLFEPGYEIICLPVKWRWQEQASLALIELSVEFLAKQTQQWDEEIPIVLPLLGCGFGERNPEEVLPILEKYLTSDRFVLVLRDDEATKKYADTLRPGARRDKSMEK